MELPTALSSLLRGWVGEREKDVQGVEKWVGGMRPRAHVYEYTPSRRRCRQRRKGQRRWLPHSLASFTRSIQQQRSAQSPIWPLHQRKQNSFFFLNFNYLKRARAPSEFFNLKIAPKWLICFITSRIGQCPHSGGE